MAQHTVGEAPVQRQLRHVEATGLLDQGFRAETIGGELVIRGAPGDWHQDVVTRLAAWLHAWAESHGGAVRVGPYGVELDAEHSLRPDVVFVTAPRTHLIFEDGLYVGPDLVAEVSSRGTKSLDLNEKHSVYERLEVAEYWVVDLDAGSVLIHRLGPSGYLPPETATGDDVVEPTATPGLRFTVAALLGSGVYHA